MPHRPSLTAVLGLLAACTVLLQLGPVYWPGAGYVLAMAAVLPAATASALSPDRSAWFFVVVCFLLGVITPDELFVYLTMTGPLALTLGLTARRPAWQSVVAAAAALTAGMMLAPHLFGLWPFGGAESGWAWPARLLTCLAVALPYAALWRYLVRRLLLRLPFSPLNRLYWEK
ncbi:MAG TPA: hypothetical protein VNT75_15880 [Symbiobacteriaceae bacterium]|nr:hypothetical protein [Symbiobacteriaceae bacterium]